MFRHGPTSAARAHVTRGLITPRVHSHTQSSHRPESVPLPAHAYRGRPDRDRRAHSSSGSQHTLGSLHLAYISRATLRTVRLQPHTWEVNQAQPPGCSTVWLGDCARYLPRCIGVAVEKCKRLRVFTQRTFTSPGPWPLSPSADLQAYSTLIARLHLRPSSLSQQKERVLAHSI